MCFLKSSKEVVLKDNVNLFSGLDNTSFFFLQLNAILSFKSFSKHCEV